MASEASEALVAKPLPQLLEGLGMAVANANKALIANQGDESRMVINSAEIELAIAVNLAKGSEFQASAGGGIYGFSVNASYARTYNFSEEASSRIKLQVAVTPPQPTE